MVNSDQIKKEKRYVYVIVLCCCVAIFVADYTGYQIPPLSHLIMPALNINEADFARLFASYMIAGIFLCLVSGLLCDKFGAKKSIGISIIISSFAVIARAFTTDFSTFYICMLVIGIMPTFISTNTMKIVANWAPPNKVGVYIGFAIAGGPIGTTLAMSTTAMFPSLKSAFLTSAIASVVMMILWFIFMKDKPKHQLYGNNDLQQAPQVPLLTGLRIVIKSKDMWVIGLCLGFILAPAVCATTFLPLALQAVKGMDAVAAGATTSIIMIGNFVGSFCGPILCMIIGKLKPYLFCSCILLGLGMAFAWRFENNILVAIGLFVTGFTIAAVMAQLISLPVLFKEIGATLAGTAGGFVLSIRLLFAVLVPSYIIAPITGNNYTLMFIIAGIMPFVAAILSLRLPDFFSKKSNVDSNK